MNKIVIIGSSHHNTYSMIRCYGERGIRPDLILYGNPDSYILQSVYIGEIHVAKDATDAILLLRKFYTDCLVIACSDEVASFMDKSYEELIRYFYFFNCGSTGMLTYFMDKVVQSDVASQVGLKVPSSIDAKPDKIDPRNLSYPCIIKPLESINGGKNIQICRSETEVRTALNSFDVESKVMIQQYVEKDFELVVVGLSFNGDIHIPAFIHKHRETKGGTTYATVRPVSELPTNVLSSCRRLVEKMSYQGLFGIELICKDEDFYFIEINLRNDATTYAIAIAGCNLPLAFWGLVNGQNASNIFAKPIRKINSMVEFKDFVHVLKRHVSLLTWIKQRKGCECKYCYSSLDKRPYRKQKQDFIKFLFKMIYTHGIVR